MSETKQGAVELPELLENVTARNNKRAFSRFRGADVETQHQAALRYCREDQLLAALTALRDKDAELAQAKATEHAAVLQVGQTARELGYMQNRAERAEAALAKAHEQNAGLLFAGNPMANACFNLGQEAYSGSYDKGLMRRMQRDWDAARKPAPPSVPAKE